MPFTNPDPRKRQLGGAAGGGGATSPSGGPSTAGASTPGFVDFGRILSANQQGAQQMAGGLASKVGQQGQQATNAIDSAHQGFQSQVAAGTNNYSRPVVGAGSTSTASLSDQYRQAGAVATAAADHGYTGPKDWVGGKIDVPGLTTQAVQAGDAAHNLTSAGGVASLLREQVQGPYSAGMAGLDAALAGAAGGSQFRSLSDMYGGLSQRLADYQTADGQLVTDATATSDANQKNAGEDAPDLNRRAGETAPPPTLTSGTPAATGATGNLTPGSDRNHLLGLPLGKKKIPKGHP